MKKRYSFLTLVLLLMLLPLVANAKEAGIRGIAFPWVKDTPLWEGPMGNTEILAHVGKNEALLLIGPSEKGWQKVRYNRQEGFMYTRTLQCLTRENIELGWGEPARAGISLLSAPEEAANILCALAPGDLCYTVGVNDGFYKVLFGEHLGYVHSSQLNLTEIPYENQASTQVPRFFVQGQSTGLPVSMASLLGEKPKKADGTPVSGADFVEEAEKYLGIRYVHGGETPAGFDCSGLIYYVYNLLGYTVPRSVEAQSRCGHAVGNDLLKPGDLVFFATLGGKSPSHVGIYLGNGEFIHSPNARSKVRVDALSGYWKNVYISARRLT